MAGRNGIAPPAVLADTTAVIAAATASHKSYDGLMSDLPEWWANVFYPLDNELVFGTKTPEDFVSEIKAKTIEYWAGK
jgi:raffinose/stachyose/melibiose transport system substrate-binding protein